MAPMNRVSRDLESFITATMGMTSMLAILEAIIGKNTFERRLLRDIDKRLEEIRREQITLTIARAAYVTHGQPYLKGVTIDLPA